jgi:hypothetical protein
VTYSRRPAVQSAAGTGPTVTSARAARSVLMRRSLLAALIALAAAAPAAHADAPWSAPEPVTGAVGMPSSAVFTARGHGAIAAPGTAAAGVIEHGTAVTPIDAIGALGAAQQLPVYFGRLVTYGADTLALVGQRPAQNGAQAAKAPILVASGKAGALGTPRAVAGTAGQQLYAVAGSPRGTIALVTGTARTRIVWSGKGGGTLKRVLTIRVSTRGRGAAVAIGSHGDLLVANEDNHIIYSRHIGPTGHAAPGHRLGAGVQAEIQARYDDSGRQEVAWMSQRVDEGDAVTGAIASYTSAAKGHNFTKAVVIGRDDVAGTGRYVSLPGIRLVGSGSDSSVLAVTIYSGGHFRVQVLNVAAGEVQSTTLMPSAEGDDVILGDLAYARAGGTVVLWRSGTRGTDTNGNPQRIFAAVRPGGAADFGPAEAVSPAVDPTTPRRATRPRWSRRPSPRSIR